MFHSTKGNCMKEHVRSPFILQNHLSNPLNGQHIHFQTHGYGPKIKIHGTIDFSLLLKVTFRLLEYPIWTQSYAYDWQGLVMLNKALNQPIIVANLRCLPKKKKWILSWWVHVFSLIAKDWRIHWVSMDLCFNHGIQPWGESSPVAALQFWWVHPKINGFLLPDSIAMVIFHSFGRIQLL